MIETNLQFPLASAFLALPLEGMAKRQFQAVQEALKPWANILTFQNPQSPHMTLHFFGSVMQIEYGDIVSAAEMIASRTAPFTLQIDGTGTFGSRGAVHVLYCSVQFSPELAAIKKLCPWQNPPGKPFSPHITIARVKHPERFEVIRPKVEQALKDTAFPWEVDRLRLYAEINGNKQTAIGEWGFV
jgi:2'-5' RNA ligase